MVVVGKCKSYLDPLLIIIVLLSAKIWIVADCYTSLFRVACLHNLHGRARRHVKIRRSGQCRHFTGGK